MAGPINIHGKDYWPVADRVRMAHEAEDVLQSIITDPVQTFEDGGVVFRAIVTFLSGRAFTGHAYESPKSKGIAGQAPWEVAETSAIGRALGLAGFGSDDSIASAEEVQNKRAPVETPRQSAPVITTPIKSSAPTNAAAAVDAANAHLVSEGRKPYYTGDSKMFHATGAYKKMTGRSSFPGGANADWQEVTDELIQYALSQQDAPQTVTT